MITIEGVAPNMIANNLEPAYTVHHGETLKNKIEYRTILQCKFAVETDCQCTLKC